VLNIAECEDVNGFGSLGDCIKNADSPKGMCMYGPPNGETTSPSAAEINTANAL